MGKEAKVQKDRLCNQCKKTLTTDAQGIKNHARTCQG